MATSINPGATPAAGLTAPARLPLRGWSVEFARRWNSGTYSLFVLHGNIFDVFPVQHGAGLRYAPLKTFLARRFFPERACLLFYDIGDGLTFGTAEMQKQFSSGWRSTTRSRARTCAKPGRPASGCGWRRCCAAFSPA
jgi:hypothetical protein